MKLATTFITLSLALTAIATPLGDRAVFKRHTGVPANNARRYILQSRMDAPPACIAKAAAPSNSTDLPDLSNSTVIDPTATDAPTNSTDDGSADSSTDATDDGSADDTADATDDGSSDDTADTTDDGSEDDSADATDDGSADNSTATDSSNSTDARRRRRRFATRIAQFDLPDIAFEWQQLCLVSGGDIFTVHSPCIELAGIGGINALLVDADPCAQQDISDAMITFAKSPGISNRDALISYALRYRRHPRNAVNILGVIPSSLYCQRAPINPELVGVVNDQLDGVNPGLFGSPNVPMVPFGSDGTCPLGTVADISSCSCVDPTAVNGTDVAPTDDGTVDDAIATADATDASDATATETATADDATATADDAAADDSTSTDDAASADDSTDSSDDTSTDSADATSTDSADATSTDAAAAAATDKNDGPNFQPDDISGDVNDPNGR